MTEYYRVLISEGLFEELGRRNNQRVAVEWGDPDEKGYYTPTLVSPPTNIAIHDVIKERERQDGKWGEQNHDATVWLGVLGEEYGELCKAILENRFATRFKSPEEARHWRDEARDEATQVAAVAVAIMEWMDRDWPIDDTDYGHKLAEDAGMVVADA